MYLQSVAKGESIVIKQRRREGHIGEWLHEESGAHVTPERFGNKGPDGISSEGTTSI